MLHLASRSPRRAELLARLGLAFGLLDLDVPEQRGGDEPAADYVRRVAREKAGAGLLEVVAVSGAVVALAPNYVVYLAGRALIGVVIGGFWSMSAATAIRLVPTAQVPRALAVFNGGNAFIFCHDTIKGSLCSISIDFFVSCCIGSGLGVS